MLAEEWSWNCHFFSTSDRTASVSTMLELTNLRGLANYFFFSVGTKNLAHKRKLFNNSLGMRLYLWDLAAPMTQQLYLTSHYQETWLQPSIASVGAQHADKCKLFLVWLEIGCCGNSLRVGHFPFQIWVAFTNILPYAKFILSLFFLFKHLIPAITEICAFKIHG